MDAYPTGAPAADIPISVIICTRGRPELLSDSVESILSGERLPTEIVVVDQSDERHPSLEQRQMPAGCVLRYFHVKSRGLSRARNQAFRIAQHDILVWTDDDVRVTPTWLTVLVSKLLDGGPKTVVTGRVLPDEIETHGGFVPTLKTSEVPAVYQGRLTIDPLVTFNMAMHRQAFADIGGFDEQIGPGTRFPAAEDNDLAFRLLEAGYRILYVPEAILYHRAWRGAGEYVRLRWGYGRGQGAFFAKHLSLRDPHILKRLVRRVGGVIKRSPRRFFYEPRLAGGDLAYVAGLLSATAERLLRRPDAR